MHRIHRFMPITTGILVGLAWGLLAALLEGLPLLLQGSPWMFLGSRLLAQAYLVVIYGTLYALAGGLLGSAAWVILWVSRRNASRAELAGLYAGLFAAAMAAILWLQRFTLNILGWVVILLLVILTGAGAGWLLHRAAQGKAVSWKTFRNTILATFAIAVVAVLVTAGFRAFFRDRALFNPPLTDKVATPEQPNIVLITAGGVRPDHLGTYGYGITGDPEISPNIDALAQRGIRFERAFAQASWTEPSLASLLTSLYPSELGITCRAAISCQPHLDAKRTTLAEVLQNAGYHTRAYLNSHWLSKELGFAQGFDEFETIRTEEPFDLGAMRSRTLGWLLGCHRDAAPCRLLVQGHELLFDKPIPPGWGGDHTNARVSHFLDLHGGERFFLWIHYSEALPPYSLEPPFRSMPEGDMATPENRLKRMGYWELGDPFTPREKLLPRDNEGLIALYDGEVHRIDRLVGGVIGILDGHGLTDRTLIVFTADHGQEFSEHGGYTYGHSLYDEVLRVPLIFAGSALVPPGQTVETTVGLLDLAPTLTELSSVSLPLEAEGRSLVPVLQGQALAEEPVFSESLYRVPYELKAMRQDKHKLVYRIDDEQFVLYNLQADPSEQHDVSAETPQVAETLKRDLLDWMAHTRQMAQDLPRAVQPSEFSDAVW